MDIDTAPRSTIAQPPQTQVCLWPALRPLYWTDPRLRYNRCIDIETVRWLPSIPEVLIPLPWAISILFPVAVGCLNGWLSWSPTTPTKYRCSRLISGLTKFKPRWATWGMWMWMPMMASPLPMPTNTKPKCCCEGCGFYPTSKKSCKWPILIKPWPRTSKPYFWPRQRSMAF